MDMDHVLGALGGIVLILVIWFISTIRSDLAVRDIAGQCQTIGAFEFYGKVYDCKPRPAPAHDGDV